MAEEKLLGSLLLPSYRISPCFSSDGISRKFSFKAEHNNMKTYYFAAESKDVQQQWMNALSLASIMQLNIISPTAKVSKPLNNNLNHKVGEFNNSNYQHGIMKHRNNNNNNEFQESKNLSIRLAKDLNEDESGFIAYQAKRNKDNSAIMYASSDYYNSNFINTSLNLYNSVGLPSLYSDQMLPYKSYLSAPPKPQRLYYPMMTYSNLIDYNSPDLINSCNPMNSFVDNYGPYFPNNNISSQYPEFIEDSEFQSIPLTYYPRLPPRPHSADFLERNQDDDFDEECQNAFQKDTNNPFISNVTNIAPKILPSRPKSSIALYDPMLKSQKYQSELYNRNYFYNDSKPFEKKDYFSKLESNENQNLSQYFMFSNEGNYLLKNPVKREELNSEMLNNYDKNEKNSFLVSSTLPNEYVPKFDTQYNDPKNTLTDNKFLSKSDSTGKETSNTSDDECKFKLNSFKLIIKQSI